MTIKTIAFLDNNDCVVNTADFDINASDNVIQEICETNGGVRYQSFEEYGTCSTGDIWLGYAYQPPCPGEGYVWTEGETKWYWKSPNNS